MPGNDADADSAAGRGPSQDRQAGCARLVRLLRTGELTAIRVPSAEEAVRDVCPARADLVGDRHRMRQRLKAFSLRHGRIYRDGSS